MEYETQKYNMILQKCFKFYSGFCKKYQCPEKSSLY